MGLNNQRGPDRLLFVVDNEWVILALLLPLIIFPTWLTYIALLLVPLLWLLRKITYGNFIVPTPSDLAILVFLVMVLVSLYATFDVAFSAPRVAAVVYGIAVYYATAVGTSRSKKGLLTGVGVLLMCGLIVVGLSLVGTSWSTKLSFLTPLTDRLPQWVLFQAAPEGFAPNQVAGTLLWILPLLLALTIAALIDTRMLRNGTKANKAIALLLLAGSVLMLGTFLLAQSRSGLIGLIASSLLMAVMARVYRRPLLLAGFLVLLVVAAGVLLPRGIAWMDQDSLISLADQSVGQFDQLAVSQSLEGRLEIWSRAIYGLEDFPLTGMGVGSFRRVMPVLFPLFIIDPRVDIAHAHNHLLQTGLDLGLPGLIAYITIWLLAGLTLWRAWRAQRSLWSRALIIGFAGCLSGYFVYALADTVALGAKPGFIFWLLLGLIAGLHQLLTSSLLVSN